MKDSLKAFLAALACICCAPAAAENSAEPAALPTAELPAYIQCAPYARAVSGIAIFGDARTWWGQAQGRYATGTVPRAGAVMAFEPHRGMALGHVATVSRIIDSRNILLDHANWSPVKGRRGQVEKDVLAVDVSPDNDWTMVRVWYAPLGGLGTTAWPVSGFIYSDKAPGATPVRIARSPVREGPSQRFLTAFAEFR